MDKNKKRYIFNIGYNAFMDGLSVKQNPFKEESRRQLWRDGWIMASKIEFDIGDE